MSLADMMPNLQIIEDEKIEEYIEQEQEPIKKEFDPDENFNNIKQEEEEEEEEEQEEEEEKILEVKEVKPVKKKRVLSEEQKQKMKEGRQKEREAKKQSIPPQTEKNEENNEIIEKDLTPLEEPKEEKILEVKEIKPVKKKRVMSEKQKEALLKGRQKGLETRRKKQQEKKELKELENKKKNLSHQKLKNEVKTLEHTISLEDAVLNGIEKYEKIRKERKANKKAQLEQEYIKSTLQAGQMPTRNIQGLSRRQQLLSLIQ